MEGIIKSFVGLIIVDILRKSPGTGNDEVSLFNDSPTVNPFHKPSSLKMGYLIISCKNACNVA